MVTMQSWLFLSTYSSFREKVLSETHFNNFIHIGYNSFPELNSKIAQACAFVLSNYYHTFLFDLIIILSSSAVAFALIDNLILISRGLCSQ